jgi:hypothetical protein
MATPSLPLKYTTIRASILVHPSNPKEFSLTPLNVIVECSSPRRRDELRSVLYSVFVQGGAILFESRLTITIFIRIDGGNGRGSGEQVAEEESRVINAAASALVEAGIPLRFIPIAANVKINTNDTNATNVAAAALVVFSMQDLSKHNNGDIDMNDNDEDDENCQPIFFDSKHHQLSSLLTSTQLKRLIDEGRKASIEYMQNTYRA